MKANLILLYCLLLAGFCHAQDMVNRDVETKANELSKTANAYLQQSDFSNAIMVYQRLVNLEPANIGHRRNLAYVYLKKGDLLNAESVIMPLLKVETADEETFQIAARILSGMKKNEEAIKAITKGIYKFPNAGILYADKGELLIDAQKYKEATSVWEKGIERDARFYLNYYNLAKVYFFTKNYLWAILYGEIFVNMESFSPKTIEIKKNIFESYKLLMTNLNSLALDGKSHFETPRSFEESYLSILYRYRQLVNNGINMENLIMLRTRFLLEWNKLYAKQFPFELIDQQHLYAKKGYYTCYNQWLFGSIENTRQYTEWAQNNEEKMNQFDAFFRMNKLVPRNNQYYQHNN